MSVSSEECTGRRLAWPAPVRTLVQKYWNGFFTNPVRNTLTAQPAVATGTIRVRFTRSANQASGTAPSTRATPPNEEMPRITVSDTPKASWRSGRSTAMATLSNSSITLRRKSTTSMLAPPARIPCRRVMGASPTPGSRSSGSTTTSDLAACSAKRLDSSSKTAEARLAGSSSCDSSTSGSTGSSTDPPSGQDTRPSVLRRARHLLFTEDDFIDYCSSPSYGEG